MPKIFVFCFSKTKSVQLFRKFTRETVRVLTRLNIAFTLDPELLNRLYRASVRVYPHPSESKKTIFIAKPN